MSRRNRFCIWRVFFACSFFIFSTSSSLPPSRLHFAPKQPTNKFFRARRRFPITRFREEQTYRVETTDSRFGTYQPRNSTRYSNKHPPHKALGFLSRCSCDPFRTCACWKYDRYRAWPLYGSSLYCLYKTTQSTLVLINQ